MANRFYVEPGRSPLLDTAGLALKLMDLKQSADIAKTHAGLMKEDQALRGREFERKGEEMNILYGQPGIAGQRTGGLKQQELGLTERTVAAKEAEIPFHKAKWNAADTASTELKLGYAKKMSGVDIGKILSPILEPMKEAVKNPQATPERGALVKQFTGESWPFYQQAIMDNLVAEGEKLDPMNPNDQKAIKKLVKLMDAVGQDPDGTGTMSFASGEMGRTIEAMQLEKQEIAAKGKPDPAIQNYRLYVDQMKSMNKTPLPFFDYQKALQPEKSEFYTPIQTSTGILKMQGRTGEITPITDSTGKPVLPVAADIGLAGQKTGAEETAKKEADRMADLKKNYPKIREAYTSLDRQWDLVDKTIDKAITQIGPFTTGLGSWLAVIPASEAKDLSKNIETIKANIGFDKLQDMRQNSPTGGALGQVSDFENRLLQAVKGSSDTNQSDVQLKNNLLAIKEDLKALRAQKKFALDYDFRELKQKESEKPTTKNDFSKMSNDELLKELGK